MDGPDNTNPPRTWTDETLAMSERHKLLLEELARMRRSPRTGDRPEQRSDASGNPPRAERPSASSAASDGAQR